MSGIQIPPFGIQIYLLEMSKFGLWINGIWIPQVGIQILVLKMWGGVQNNVTWVC